LACRYWRIEYAASPTRSWLLPARLTGAARAACGDKVVARAAVAVAEDVSPVVTPPVIAVGADADGPFETTVDSTGFVEVIDAWEAQGTAYMAMPLYEGPTLERVIDSARRERERVREIAAALARSRRAGPPQPALMRMTSGFVPGPGSLSEALMAHAGLPSVAADRGLKGAGVIGLEALALEPPALLITDRPEAMPPLVRRLPTRVVAFDRHLLNCGGPSLVPAAHRLAAIRDSLP
jgi:hypothetical protein